MNAEDLRKALKDLGWSQAELARRLGREPHTITEWMYRGEVPAYASAYLRAVVMAKRIVDG